MQPLNVLGCSLGIIHFPADWSRLTLDIFQVVKLFPIGITLYCLYIRTILCLGDLARQKPFFLLSDCQLAWEQTRFYVNVHQDTSVVKVQLVSASKVSDLQSSFCLAPEILQCFQSCSLLKGFNSWLLLNLSVSKPPPAVMSVTSALVEKTEMNKVIQLPYVDVVRYTCVARSTLAVRMASLLLFLY